MKSPATLTPLEAGSPKRAKTRGKFNARADAVDLARRKFEAADAAVRVAIVGRELDAALVGEKNLVRTVGSIARALAIYVAVTQLGAPKRVLAVAIATSARRVQHACRFVEAWRAAPLIDDALARVEAALPAAL